MQKLSGKNIIVTGAASGIGKAIVSICIKNNATVFALDINENGLETLKHKIKSKKLHTLKTDVSVSNEVEFAFENIRNLTNNIDGLVNNAGIYFGKSIFDYSDDEIETVFSVNVKSAIIASKIFAKFVLANNKQGTIVNISSVSGQEGSSDAIYGLSKAALIGLTKSNALNFSPFIRVNAITPGIVETPMFKNIPAERINEYRKSELLQESIKPEDIAETVMFLLSDSAKHYTGAVFDINNGCYMR